MTPATVLCLVNLGVPIRTAGTRRPLANSPFSSPEALAAALAPLESGQVTAADVASIRRLATATRRVVDGVSAGRRPSLRDLNELAGDLVGSPRLRWTDDGRLARHWDWRGAPTIADRLARRVIDELAAIDPGRLRRCARPECGLTFYDRSRSGTQRWHAQSPCGWRERQRRHRATPYRHGGVAPTI